MKKHTFKRKMIAFYLQYWCRGDMFAMFNDAQKLSKKDMIKEMAPDFDKLNAITKLIVLFMCIFGKSAGFIALTALGYIGFAFQILGYLVGVFGYACDYYGPGIAKKLFYK